MSYPAGKDKNSLDAILPLIPERHRNPMVLDLIGNALESHPEQYIRDAVAYASDQVKGGWIQYRKYLDGAIQGRWAAGYLEVRDQAPSVYADTLLPSAGFSPGGFGARGRYPNGTITGSRRTDGNCQAAVEFLNRRAMARGEVTA